MTNGIGRRSLLAALGRLPLLLAGAYAGLLPRRTAAREAAMALGPHELAVLERFAWLLFPIPEAPAAPYQRVAAAIAAAVANDPARLALAGSGIAQLDAAAGGDFLGLAEAAQVERLRQIESGGFFQFLYEEVRNRLWDDREVWALIGYEGSSLEKGGYLNRGLADIDWL